MSVSMVYKYGQLITKRQRRVCAQTGHFWSAWMQSTTQYSSGERAAIGALPQVMDVSRSRACRRCSAIATEVLYKNPQWVTPEEMAEQLRQRDFNDRLEQTIAAFHAASVELDRLEGYER